MEGGYFRGPRNQRAMPGRGARNQYWWGAQSPKGCSNQHANPRNRALGGGLSSGKGVALSRGSPPPCVVDVAGRGDVCFPITHPLVMSCLCSQWRVSPPPPPCSFSPHSFSPQARAGADQKDRELSKVSGGPVVRDQPASPSLARL